MKVTLLLAQCSSELLKRSVQIVTNVLQELEVEIQPIELHKLPYYDGKKSRQMESTMNAILNSEGVITMSSVPMLGMHGAMQSFFDNATLYDMSYFNKPILAITCSKWLGEQEAAQMIQKCWNILGGVDGGSIAMNEALPMTPYLQRIEKEVENFYRLVKQDRPNIGSSQRLLYYNIKQGGMLQVPVNRQGIEAEEKPAESKPEVRSFADMIRQDDTFAARVDRHSEKMKTHHSSDEKDAHHINFSTKEQTIKEIASLFDKESKDEGFTSMQAGVYTRPTKISTGVVGHKKLQQIPHYFAAQHDRTLHMIIKYQLTDLNEHGYVVIANGDCTYEDEIEGSPTVEMLLTEEVLQEILAKKITYQKAFMLGKLKVKGNFSVLPKLDQAFKAL